MTKQEQSIIIDSINSVFNEKIAKITDERNKAIESEKETRTQLKEINTEIKELKTKMKELERENKTLKKDLTKYEKIFSNIK